MAQCQAKNIHESFYSLYDKSGKPPQDGGKLCDDGVMESCEVGLIRSAAATERGTVRLVYTKERKDLDHKK